MILAPTFLGLVAYELLEMWVLEVPRVSGAGVLIHSVQIAVIFSATFAVLRAWREKTAREEARGDDATRGVREACSSGAPLRVERPLDLRLRP